MLVQIAVVLRGGKAKSLNVVFKLNKRPVQDSLVTELLVTFRTRLALSRRHIRRFLGFLSTVLVL